MLIGSFNTVGESEVKQTFVGKEPLHDELRPFMLTAQGAQVSVNEFRRNLMKEPGNEVAGARAGPRQQSSKL